MDSLRFMFLTLCWVGVMTSLHPFLADRLRARTNPLLSQALAQPIEFRLDAADRPARRAP